MTSPEQTKLNVFLSYSHKDEDLLNKLLPHLATLKRQEFINTWYDRQISGGTEWAKAIEDNLATADIILLLISADFIASDYCWTVELKQAIDRHEAGTARVIPIILRSCDWKGTPFSELQGFPTNAKPVVSYSQPDEAFTEIAQGIRKVVDEIIAQRQLTASASPLASQPSSQTTEPAVELWVHAWDKQVYKGTPRAELHWTDYFNQDNAIRKIASPEIWRDVLLDELKQATQKLTQNNANKQIDIKGRMPLTVALAIGKQFPDTKGYTLQVLQRTAGKNTFWRSDTTPSSASLIVQEHDSSQPGNNLLFAIAISPKPVYQDVLTFYQNSGKTFDSFVFAEPEKSIASSISNADALSLAKHGELLMYESLRKYQANCIHLIVAGPQGFSIFLGQKLRLLGKITTYEHQMTDVNHYVQSVTL